MVVLAYPLFTLTRKNNNETKLDLYRYGFADHTGLPVRICILQITPVFKITRGTLLIACWSHQAVVQRKL